MSARSGKEQYREADSTQKATGIQFEVVRREDIVQQSHIQVVATQLYRDEQRNPAPFSALDRRLGTSSKDHKCETCGKEVLECPGHWGYMELQQPVFHWGYFTQVINILQSICKNCSHVMLEETVKQKYRNLMNSPQTYINKKKHRKEIQLLAKKKSSCPNCCAINGVVKKGPGLMKIVHDQYRNCPKKKKEEALQERIAQWTAITGADEDEAKKIALMMLTINLNARDVFHLFKRIPEVDVPLLGMPYTQRPHDLILTAIPVPPIVIRPSVNSDLKSGTTEDDITMIINEISFINEVIKKHEANNAKPNMIFEDWEYLQIKAALLINGQVRGIPLDKQPQKAKRGFIQRLKGKEGRFRGNLSGKRVDFSGRTVISPNPNLEIDEVGVPRHVAMTLTYPERVTPNNLQWLRGLVTAGANTHPGANYWSRTNGENVSRKDLKYGDPKTIAQNLKPGDTVERHLQDGDIVLFNRQPSLHKLSIMAHRVKVQKTRTFSFNECVCAPYNADFDGDEMNLHVPQTEEARAEALILMGNKSNLLTPRSGELMIAATQDFLTGAYLLTQKDQYFSKDEFCQLITSFLKGKDEQLRIDLPSPTFIKPQMLWTGKQVFNVLLRPNKDCPVLCNLRAKAKPYKGTKEEMIEDDSYVVIRNSELLAGALDKNTLGSGGKSNVFYVLLRDWGEDVAIRAMARLSRLTSNFLMNRGFSIGIEDVMPEPALIATKQRLVEEKYTECHQLIAEHRDNTLLCIPGYTLDLTLEARLLGVLSSIREQAGNACLKALPRENSPMIMANCGSKGSTINISQMISCVGQQAISGKRVPDGFENRALPHFPHYSKVPAAKGFVQNSFFTGLTPTEFFFHTMAGREGLVDTAVKTAETGYMQRRLMKGLEDLCVQYDNTVRNCNGMVIQFCFGEDGLDPTYMEGKDQPVEFERVLEHVKAKSPFKSEQPLNGKSIRQYTEQMIANDFTELGSHGVEFKRKLACFMNSVADRVDQLRERLGLGQDELKGVEQWLERLTMGQLVEFLQTCRDKFMQAKIEPGTAVGALAGQSIGEPGTQMTLKTFHFAGVAAMNITLGVPRILEIMNAAKTMSTPLISAQLEKSKDMSVSDEAHARKIKGRIEKTLLGEICRYLEEVILPDEFFIIVRIDLGRIKLLKLEINSTIIAYMIEDSSKPKIKAKIERMSVSVLKVTPRMDNEKRDPQEVLQELAVLLPLVVVAGIPTVSRAVIVHSEGVRNSEKSLELAIEGSGLRDVLATQGVNWRTTTSNNILEVRQVLGIEAARATIIKEIRLTMQDYGITLDVRHLMLLADLMTSQGDIHGMTRFGLEKIKESVLMLASFEKTSDHLFEAAFYGQRDTLSGVSESIIMGNPMPMGTGLCTTLYKSPNVEAAPEQRTPFFNHLFNESG